MRARNVLVGLGSGVGLGISWLALDYFASQVFGLPFAPFVLFGWIVRLLPGGVITALLETMVGTLQQLELGSTSDIGKTIQSAIAGLSLLGIMGVLGALYAIVNRRVQERMWLSGLAVGLVLWVILLPASLSEGLGWGSLGWTLLLSILWGITLAWVLARSVPETETIQPETARSVPSVNQISRRRVLIGVGVSAILLALGAFGLARLLGRNNSGLTESGGEADITIEPPPTPAPQAGFEPVVNTRPEITPIDEFYRVDINLAPPEVNSDTWNLEISGLVNNPLKLTYDDLTAIPHQNFYATLECISNQIGGDLISTTWFSGVALRDVLERAGVQSQTVDIKFSCADGYTESLPLDSALDPKTCLCFAMGGKPLQVKHGFPVRLFTPNRFGMKNPKWITKIEAIDQDYRGFWQQRGWSEQAFVQTTTVIDSTNMGHGSAVRVGGIAYAGARGVQQVQVRVDDEEWQTAELKPALSDLTWVLWRAELPLEPGEHRLSARAIDGTGQVQVEQSSPPIPDGATGYHQRSVNL